MLLDDSSVVDSSSEQPQRLRGYVTNAQSEVDACGFRAADGYGRAALMNASTTLIPKAKSTALHEEAPAPAFSAQEWRWRRKKVIWKEVS